MDDETMVLGRRDAARTFALADLTIRSDGDGRTVEAFAAVFGTRAEIRDQDGHYHEVLDPSSFNKTVADNGTRFGVFYNHARTIYGTPDGTLSVPIGVPEQVEVNERGVWTVTRYLDNPLADSVLDAIKGGAIRGQSFSGTFLRSTKTRAAKRGELPTITRNEVKMREYGPTPFPAYVEAAITGTRSLSSFLDDLANLDPEDLERVRTMLGLPTLTGSEQVPGDTPAAVATSTTTDAPPTRHATDTLKLRARARKIGVLS